MPSLRSFSRIATLVALLACVAGAATAQSQDGQERSDAPRERSVPRSEDRGHRNSMSDSVRRVRNETGGQVLSVERMQYDGREINRVKYVDENGRVRTMDDASGVRRSDSRVRPSRDVPRPQPARGDNPSRP